MVDFNLAEFAFSKKISYLLMTYIAIRLIIKETKLILKLVVLFSQNY